MNSAIDARTQLSFLPRDEQSGITWPITVQSLQLASAKSYANSQLRPSRSGNIGAASLNSFAQPDGAMLPSDGALLSLDGALPSLNGALLSLDGALPSLDGALPSLDGALLSLDGALLSLDGALLALDGALLALDGAYGAAVSRYFRTKAAHAAAGTVPALRLFEANQPNNEIRSPCP